MDLTRGDFEIADIIRKAQKGSNTGVDLSGRDSIIRKAQKGSVYDRSMSGQDNAWC